jgi:hypothetical protein
VRLKRTGADELLEQLDHFRLAGNLSDRLFVIFGRERVGFLAGELFESRASGSNPIILTDNVTDLVRPPSEFSEPSKH